jgi:exopolysaccharide biosynthesis polyprenyl glycosylphosphotransferase
MQHHPAIIDVAVKYCFATALPVTTKHMQNNTPAYYEEMVGKCEGEGVDLGTGYANSTVPEETTRIRVSGPSTMTGTAAKPQPSQLRRTMQSQSQSNPPEPPQNACPDPDDAPPTFFDGSYFIGGSQDKPTKFNRDRRLFDYSVPSWSYIYNVTLIVLDMAMALISAVVVFITFPGSYRYLQANSILGDGLVEYLLLTCVTWVVSLALSHIYERHTMGEGYALYGKIMQATFVGFIILATVSYFFKMNVPRSLTFFVPVLSALFTITERWLMRRALHRNRNKGEYNYPTVVIGSPAGIRRTLHHLHDNKALGYAPIAICPVTSISDDDAAGHAQRLVSVPFEPRNNYEASLRVLPMNSHLPQTAKYLKAQTVLVSDVMMSYSETMRTLSLAVESMGIELALTSTVADLNGARLHLRNDPYMPVLTARLPQYSLPTRIIKRIIDIVISLTALILSFPVLLVVGILIKREDGGPVFYSQKRVGIYGKLFTMYKFRSMRTDADKIKRKLAKEAGLEDRFIFKMKDDPRVTHIGKFIRKTSLDEFPQFFNVLRGDMSMVGPRPPLPEEVARYGTLYSTRLLAKPGITGPWQISGRSDLTQEQSEFADVSYIQSWTLTGDLAILFKTVSAVVRGTGSY